LKKFKKDRPGGKSDIGRFCVLTVQVMVYLVLGCIVFIALPAIAFVLIETKWNYLDSVYFAFITLTTIGFGDYVAGNTFVDFKYTRRLLHYAPRFHKMFPKNSQKKNSKKNSKKKFKKKIQKK
jgi:hypothetical protein